MIGAYLVFFLFLLWLARHHLLAVLRHGLGLGKGPVSDAEWMPIRMSFWGFVLGSLAIALWLDFFGMPFWIAVLVLAAFFMFTLVATRVICQGGIAYFTLSAAPLDGLLAFLNPRIFTAAGLLMAAVVQKMLFLDLRESLMPSLLHTRKVTYRLLNQRLVFVGIAAALTAGVAVSFVAMLALCHKYGMRQLQLDWATHTTISLYENVQSLITAPVHTGNWVVVFTVVGALVMLVLVICYHRFYWWPLHPIGYLTAYSSAMQILWFSFFVGWFCNTVCMRYGGVVLFKRMRFFFTGLIIGDFLMGGVWAVVGLFCDASYPVLPN